MKTQIVKENKRKKIIILSLCIFINCSISKKELALQNNETIKQTKFCKENCMYSEVVML